MRHYFVTIIHLETEQRLGDHLAVRGLLAGIEEARLVAVAVLIVPDVRC